MPPAARLASFCPALFCLAACLPVMTGASSECYIKQGRLVSCRMTPAVNQLPCKVVSDELLDLEVACSVSHPGVFASFQAALQNLHGD